MSKLYKTIKFDDLSGGANLDFFDPDKSKKFFISNNIKSENGVDRLRLSDDLLMIDFEHSVFENGQCIANGNITNTSYVFLLARSVAGRVELLRQLDFSAFVVVYTFGVNSDEANRLISYKNKLIAVYTDGVTRRADYSDDGGATFNAVDSPFNALLDHTVGQDGLLYVLDSNGAIYSTDDGITWVLFHAGTDRDNRFSAIASIDGFLYGLVRSLSSVQNSLVRFSGSLEYLHDFSSTNRNGSMLKFADRLYFVDVVNGTVLVGSYDKSSFSTVDFVDDFVFDGAKILFSNDDFMYFSCSVGGDFRHIYRLDINDGIFHFFSFDNNQNCDSIIEYKGFLSFQVTDFDDDGVNVYNNSRVNFQPSGFVELPIIDVEQQISAYLNLKHDPLPVGTDVLVYAKLNKASSWVLVLTSNLENAVSTIQKLVGEKSQFVQFKIELNGNSDVVDFDDDLISFWPFEEGVGTEVLDRVSENHGALNGGVSFVDGISGKALSFNGTTGFVDVSDTFSLDIVGAFSISCWFFIDTVQTGGLVVKMANAPSSGYRLFLEGGTVLKGNIYTGSQKEVSFPVSNGEWVHAVMTYDLTDLKLYVGGVEVDTEPATGAIGINALDLQIGQLQAGTGIFFKGKIDEVRMYDKALTPAEVLSLFNNPSGLVNLSPRNVSLDYLYLPSGLENSK